MARSVPICTRLQNRLSYPLPPPSSRLPRHTTQPSSMKRERAIDAPGERARWCRNREVCMKIKSVGHQVPDLHPTPETGPLQTSAPSFPGRLPSSRTAALDSSASPGLRSCVRNEALCTNLLSVGCQHKDLGFRLFGCWEGSQLQQAAGRCGAPNQNCWRCV